MSSELFPYDCCSECFYTQQAMCQNSSNSLFVRREPVALKASTSKLFHLIAAFLDPKHALYWTHCIERTRTSRYLT